MAQPGTVLVAVGAGHLAGSDSVVEMLKKRGHQGAARPVVGIIHNFVDELQVWLNV